VAVLIVVVLTGCDVYAPTWSTIHADGRNSDYSPVPGATDLTLAWQRSFDGNLTVGATVGPDGRVYLTGATPGCQLQVLDGDTGETIWCTNAVNYFAVVSSPLIDRDGRIFVADNQAMHAFDHDGTLLWETPIVGVPLSAQFTPNGRLIFMTHIGQIYVLRRETGAPVLPVYELTPGATYDPATGISACARGTADCPAANTLGIDTDTGVFIFTYWAPGEPQAGVRAMRITEDPVPSLTPLWTNDSLPGGSASSPTISVDGARVYVNDNVDSVHALDTATGAEIWSHPIGFASGGSPSLSPDGLIMPAGGGASPLLAIQDEGDTATELWRQPALLNRGIPTQAAGGLSYATVSVGSFQNDLVVVDTATGAELDREPIPGTSVFSVGTTVAPDGTVLVPTITGDLFAYRPA
jgi:outer membrane protein assembly factor BamB